MLQSQVARGAIESLGVENPERFELIHNTEGDDPPDLSAFGLGFECTEFPPNQSAIQVVHEERAHNGMAVPGLSEAGRDIRRIRDYTANPGYHLCEVTAEIQALERAFINIITGPRSKDVVGNDVLLLDQRQDDWPDLAPDAIRRALQNTRPQHVRLILLVRWTNWQVVEGGVRPPEPWVVQLHP